MVLQHDRFSASVQPCDVLEEDEGGGTTEEEEEEDDEEGGGGGSDDELEEERNEEGEDELDPPPPHVATPQMSLPGPKTGSSAGEPKSEQMNG
ncbi:MAG TPA: hypothetical protein DEB30_02645 [Candidatus Peribacter riflensis]|nr:MAG: hypothetical protein A2398_03040 [Candidatus Peribacteria bacterium RIFOXYB1_FULL_57_12]HBH20389.1 hypothetical protein [Candidatus Peribacter riflensis]HBU09676.1 hypothetical protein [Candidatus Peribacter riflensis]